MSVALSHGTGMLMKLEGSSSGAPHWTLQSVGFHGWWLFQWLNYNFALAPSAALIIFCAARYDTWISRLLSGVESPARQWLRDLRRRRPRVAWAVSAAPACAALLAIGLIRVASLEAAPITASGIRLTGATYGANCGAQGAQKVLRWQERVRLSHRCRRLG